MNPYVNVSKNKKINKPIYQTNKGLDLPKNVQSNSLLMSINMLD